MTYTCQIRVASAMINTVKRTKSKTRAALAQIMINAGEYRSLKTPPAGIRMVPGMDATASTRARNAQHQPRQGHEEGLVRKHRKTRPGPQPSERACLQGHPEVKCS